MSELEGLYSEGKYEVYKDSADEWRWMYVSEDKKEIAKSCEGYSQKRDCLRSIELMKSSRYSNVSDGGVVLADC